MGIINGVGITVGVLFGMGWWFGRSQLALLAAGLWLGMPLYNHWILASCPGDCAIRIDLLLVVPLLLAITVAALMQVVRDLRHHHARH